jgi:tetratricopeptide (TPR) repeat protein
MPVDPSHPDQSEATQAYQASEEPGETQTHAGQVSDASEDSPATTDYQPRGVPTGPGPSDVTRRLETGSPIGAETQTYAGASGQQAADRPERQQTGTETHWPPAPIEGDKIQPVRDGGLAKAGSLVGRGRYLLKNFHAKGGMGEIWLAEDCDIGREVALKRMRPGHDRHRPRFTLEAQITGQLEHPGVVPVHEVGVGDDGQPFYVMKFVRGQTLEKAIKEYHARKPASDVPPEVQQLRLLQAFVHLCHTIAYAHSRGVIHRDIKPDNVMLGPYSETVVLDWGIAKVMGQPESPGGFGSAPVRYSGETELTRAGSVQGTPSYMAPEVAQGLNAEVDHRSDIYLLGSTLYQILTGKRPRKAASLSELLELARNTPPLPPRKLKPEIPRALEAICMKAMAYSKEARYQSAGALAEDVQRYLAGEPVSAYREPWVEKAWRWARKHRRGLGMAAAVGFLVGFGLFALAQMRKAEREAALLKNQAQARTDIKEFRRRSDEAHFYLAGIKPLAEEAPYLDPQKGKAAAQEALKVIEPWGTALENLPLPPEEQDPVKQQLYDLLLLSVQAASQESPSLPEAKDLLALLDRAAGLQPPSQSYYRLQTLCYQFAGEGPKAAADQKRSEDANTPMTALDHFLLGEQARMRATHKMDVQEPKKGLQSNRDLLLESIKEYREAVKLDAGHYWAHFRLGECHLNLQQTAEAVEAFSTCVALRSDSPWGYSARAMALVSLQRFEEAEWDLAQAIRLSPDVRQFRLNRGVVYMVQGKDEAALAEFGAVTEPPEDKVLLEGVYNRAVLYLRLKQYRKALEDCNRLMAERPGFLPEKRVLRARIHFSLGKDAEGLDDLNAFLAKGRPFDNSSRRAHAERGRLLRLLIQDLPEQERKTKLLLAAGELQKAIDLGERSASVYDNQGAVLEQLGQINDAIEAYSKGLELAPKHVKLLVKRGWAYVAKRQYEKARGDFAAALKAEPGHAEAHTGLGYARACRNSEAGALRQANLALLRGGAGDYGILHNVACIYAELAETDPARTRDFEDLALDQLQRAVELWKRDRSGLDEIHLIEIEPAFHKSLRARPEFRKLLRPEG